MQTSYNNQPNPHFSPEASQALADLHQGFHIVRAADCTPQILSREFRTSYGLGIEAQHAAMIEALGEEGRVLQGSDNVPEMTTPELQELLEKRPAFFEIDSGIISDELQQAATLFDADSTGAIMQIAYAHHPLYGGKVQSFPAIRKEGNMYRILVAERSETDTRSIKEIEDDLNKVTLPTHVAETNDAIVAASQFIEHSGHPASISRQELDDWLQRYEEAGIDIGGDVAASDETLDNFVVYNGELRWCDGDALEARPIKPADVQQKVEAMKHKLEHFVQ